ncbi:MAG: hypothetical protein ABIS47_01355 [Acidimicrobiales bacterium]
MATIRATCPTCADVELTTRDLRVQVCSDTNQGSYSFRCPTCRMAVAKQAEPRIIDLLVSSGVRMHLWRLPAELHEPKQGAPFCWDDILELHDLLQAPDWFSQLLGTR